MSLKERNFGLDLIRTLAIFLVMGSHFMEYSDFYGKIIQGKSMFLLINLRNFVRICVPLFILLTGYLKSTKKEMNLNYFKSILKLLITYLVVSIIMILFKVFYLHTTESMISMILGIFNFTTITYAWYIEMYIGLFLLIPFLNILWNNIKTKKQKQLLILILILLASIPQTLQVISIENLKLDILPNWWGSEIVIFMYYFIGAYIREYQPIIKKKICILSIIFIELVFSVIIYIYCNNETFGKVIPNGLNFNTIVILTVSVLIFLLLYKVQKSNKLLKNLISKISEHSFTMYLVSSITDKLFQLNYNFNAIPIRIITNFFSILIINFFITFGISYIIDNVIKLFINNKKDKISVN